MALSATVVFEVRTVGSDTNGGGFNTAASGTDWSQQTSPQYSVTDAVTNGTTTITSATANFGTDVVGNLAYVSGGTGAITGDLYEIISRTNTTTIVVDRSTGLTAGTGATLKIGGALGSPGWAVAKMVPSNTVWVKAGTYTVTTTTPGSNGPVKYNPGTDASLAAPSRIEGYNTTRGDKGTRPLIQLQASLTTAAINIFELSGGTNKYVWADNFELDATTGNTTATGAQVNSNFQRIQRFKINHTTVNGIDLRDAREYATDCEVLNFSGTAGVQMHVSCDRTTELLRCSVHGGTTEGVNCAGSGVTLGDLLIYGITGTTKNGLVTDYDTSIFGATIYGCTGSGVYNVTRTLTTGNWVNVLSYGNSLFGFTAEAAVGPVLQLTHCAGGGNGSGNLDTNYASAAQDGFIALTADPFTNAAGGDFSLNTTAGGGAALRAAGVPGPLGSNTGYRDVGALQHADSGAAAPTLMGQACL